MAPNSPTDGLDQHPGLRICLFGQVEVIVDGQPMPRLRSRKGEWLLALLALRHGREVTRDFLIAALWPDSEEGAASASLRQSLMDLRRALGPHASRVESTTLRTLRLQATADEVDVIAFDEAVARGHTSDLERAVALYRGPLLEGCAEEWVLSERDPREQTWLSTVERLASYQLEAGSPREAADLLRRATLVDPLRESTVRLLMSALARAGDHAAVVECYRALRLRLSDELRCDPDPSTTALYEELRAEARSRVQSSQPPVRQSSALAAPMYSDAASSLPCPLTEMVGRDREAGEIAELLLSTRLVTLSGPGGVGKTRLATHVAAQCAPEFLDGVWFVDLSPVVDEDRVPAAIAASLGLPDEPRHEPLDIIVRTLRGRTVLVVLDNCEHLVDACAEAARAILSGCPRVRVLATSRQVLGIVGEAAYAVPPLSVPPPCEPHHDGNGGGDGAEVLMGFDAVRLFVRRAKAVQPGFALTSANATSVARISRSLDGIPLAIELAAARVRAMAPGEIESHLADRFDLLTSGNAAGPERHRALAATMDWSYRLLSDQEQCLLRQLSVFASGWTHDAAEAVCAPCGSPAEVMANLLGLVDRSLVVHDPQGGGRYRLLETVRQYARELLSAAGEEDATRRRHRDTFRDLVTQRSDTGLTEEEWLERVRAEHDDVRAAMDFCLEVSEGEEALRFASGMALFWMANSRLEGMKRLRSALRCKGAEGRTMLRARVLLAAADSAWGQGCHEEARVYAEEAYSIYSEAQSAAGIAWALEALGDAAYGAERFECAAAYWEDALDRLRALGDTGGTATLLGNLGEVHRRTGNSEAARRCYEQSREAALAAGEKLSLALAAVNLAAMACEAGDAASAEPLLREGISGLWGSGRYWLVPLALPSAAAAALARGDYERAADLLGAAEALREEFGIVVQPADTFLWNRCVADLRSGRSDAAVDAAWAAGRRRHMQSAVEYALQGL